MLSRAFIAWLLIALLESLQGAIRRTWIEPILGALTAARIGLAVGVVLVCVVAWTTLDWIGPPRPRQRFAIGLVWVALTVAFEIGLGRALGYSWSRIAADYDPRAGGVMPFGLFAMLVLPLVVDVVRMRWVRR